MEQKIAHLSLCENQIIVAKIKSQPDRWYRVSKYHLDTEQVAVEESDIVTNTVGLDFILETAIACEKCEPTGTHTEGWKRPKNPPNVLSPAERLTHCCNFNFCPVCGRYLR